MERRVETYHRVILRIPVVDFALLITLGVTALPANGTDRELNIIVTSLGRDLHLVRQCRPPAERVPVTALDGVRVTAVGLVARTTHELGAVTAEDLELLHVVGVIAPGAGPVVAKEVLVLVQLEGALARLPALVLLRVDSVLHDAIAEGTAVLPVPGILRIVAVAAWREGRVNPALRLRVIKSTYCP